MKIFSECLPCLLRQALWAAQNSTNSAEKVDKAMEEAVKTLAEYKNFSYAPELYEAMFSKIKKVTGENDPYLKIKQKDIAAAKRVYQALEHRLEKEGGGLFWALRIASVGNSIDSAIYPDANIEEELETELEKGFQICDIDEFEKAVKKARKLLIIGDNAGETVFDKILIKSLPERVEVLYAVRNSPVINDATVKEAVDSGLEEVAKIISQGCDTPGAVLSRCGDEFLKEFYGADIVISKGQGNLEALTGEKRPVFFLLKVKCPLIAKLTGAEVGQYVFRYGPNFNDWS